MKVFVFTVMAGIFIFHLPSSFLAVPLSAPTICASVLKDPLYDGRSLESKESFKAFELASSFFVSVIRGWTGTTVLFSTCKTCEHRPSEWVISQSKHMLWVLKRTVSMRRFF